MSLLNDNVKKYIPSLEDSDIGRFGIIEGKLYFIGDDEIEVKAAKSQNIEILEKGESIELFAIKALAKEENKEKIGGEELITKNPTNSATWKIVTETVDGKIVNKYGTDYYYVRKGTVVEGIGNLENDYIINYKDGKVLKFEEGKHKLLSYSDVLGYSEHLILNIDPRSNGWI